MRWLRQRWNFLGAREFSEICAAGKPVKGRNIFLTFDDGFASNRVVAEQVLRPMRIQAAFFVVTDFIGLEDPAAIRKFIATRIVPGSDPDAVPAAQRNMSSADLAALLEQGHIVGAHTATHARLSTLRTPADLEREIVGGADALSRLLGAPVDHFAWPFGDMASMSAEAMAVCARRFSFVYSGLRGDNSALGSRHAVRRDAVTPRDSDGLLGAWTEGLADRRYASSRAQLDQVVGC
jgi:peptidoglycan/xylan/chitin deacetylase (PgdA/CDA1 family)